MVRERGNALNNPQGKLGRSPFRARRSARLQVEPLETRQLLNASLLKDIGQAPTSPMQVQPATGGVYFSTIDAQGDFDLNYLANGSSSPITLKVFPVASAGTTDVYRGMSISNAVALGSKLVFWADGGTGDGRQPWVSDGTQIGTKELKNIAGIGPTADPTSFTLFDNRVYFTATFQPDPTTTHSRLFETDGTSAGTSQVTASDPSVNRLELYSSESLTVLGSSLLFSANGWTGPAGTISDGLKLWEVNAGGTVATKVAAVPTGSIATLAQGTTFTTAGGLAYFPVMTDATHTALWQTDGSTTKAVLTSDATPLSLTSPADLTAVGNSLSLVATPSNGSTRTLWRVTNSGGTATATALEAVPTGSTVTGGYAAGTNFLFTSSSSAGLELRSYTATGTTSTSLGLLSTDPHASVSNSVSSLGRAFLEVTSSLTNNTALWSSDGASATKLVESLLSATGGSSTSQLVTANGLVFFANSTDSSGNELWETNGTTASLVTDINPGTASAFPQSLVAVGNVVYFAALSASGSNQLWESDGVQTTKALVTGLPVANAGSNPNTAITLGTQTLFFADDSLHGQALWQTDGTTAGTSFLKSLTPGGVNPFWGTTLTLNGVSYGYFLVNGPDGSSGLWRTDGTANGTTQIQAMPARLPQNQPVVFNNQLYFAIESGAAGDASPPIQLWRTTVNGQGAELVQTPFASSSLTLTQLAVTKDASGNDAKLFFVSDDGTTGANGRTLWVLDPKTSSSFQQVVSLHDAVTGVPQSLPGISSGLGVVGAAGSPQQVVFSYADAANGVQPWISDGTPQGTKLIKNLYPPQSGVVLSSLPTDYVTISSTLGSKVIFYASTDANGYEPYVTDGTAAGTFLLKDIKPGGSTLNDPYAGDSVSTSDPLPVAVGSLAFFMANDGVHGKELWRTDGTSAGTFLVKDINTTTAPKGTPGSALDFYNTTFVVSGSTLFFTANDGQGFQLWQTDGSLGNAQRINDFPAGMRITHPQVLSALPHGLLLSAQADNLGAEPFVETFGANHQVTLAALSSVVTNPSVPVHVQATAIDSDLSLKLTYSLDSAPLGATIDPGTGAFTWNPGPDPTIQGKSFTVIVRATDNGVPAATDSKSFTIRVNAPPVFTSVPQGTQQATVGQTLVLNVSASVTFPDLNPGVEYTLDSASIAAGMSITNTGVVSWWKPSQVGNRSVVITAKEATPAATGLAALSSSVTIPINVKVAPVTISSTQLVVKNNKITGIQLNLTAPVQGYIAGHGKVKPILGATDTTRYKLVNLANNRPIKIVKAAYTTGSVKILLTPSPAISVPKKGTYSYRLTVSGLKDTKGNPVAAYTVKISIVNGKISLS